MRRRQVGRRKRMLLERNEAQLAASLRIGPPSLPGRQKIQAKAKARFEDDETLPPLPARRQIIAGKEHVPRLRRPARSGVVNIAVTPGKRRTVGKPLRGWDFKHKN